MAQDLAKEELKKKAQDASKMSALEIAVLGKNLQQNKDGGNAVTELEMDPDDADWNQLIEEAKGKGPRSWFASKVDFTLNGAHFLGKVGFPVTAGVVPLFDGAAIDLKFSKMKAEKTSKATPDPLQGEPTAYDNWIKGTGGMLVLAPVGMKNVVPVSMKSVTVTEEGLTGEAEKNLEFRNKDVTVKASGIILKKEGAELVGAKEVINGKEEKEIEGDAVITGEGVSFTPKESETPKDEQMNPELGNGDQTSAAQGESETDKGLNDVENIKGDPGLVKKLADKGVEKAKEFLSEEHSFGQDDEDEEEEDPSLKDQVKDEIKGLGKEIATKAVQKILNQDGEDAGGEEEEEEEKYEVSFSGSANLQEGTVHLGIEVGEKEEEEDPTLIQTLTTAVEDKLTDVVSSAVADLAQGKTQEAAEEFKTVGSQIKDIGEQTIDNFKKGHFSETLQKVPDRLREYLTGDVSLEDVQKDVGAMAGELIPIEDIKTLLGMEGEEDEEKNEEEEVSGDITLVSIPIVIPALMFDVTLSPEFSWKFYANISGENLRSLYEDLLGMEKSEESGTAKLKFTAGLKAALALTARAGITEGIPFLIQGYQYLYANTKLGGSIGESDEAVEASLELPVERRKNGSFGLANEDIEASLLGKFTLEGSVGAGASIESKLLVWKKTLIEKEFAKWDLATIGLNLGMRKKAGSKGLFGGWSMDEASVSLSGPQAGLGKAFTDSNPAERKYGITTPDVSESQEYKDLQENFESALELLEHFVTPPDNEALVIPQDPSDNGLVETMVNMEAVMNRFTNTWLKAQSELEVVRKQMDKFLASKGYKRKMESARKSIAKHAVRLSGLEGWKPDLKDEDGNVIGLEDYYGGLEGHGGHGFKRAMREKAKDQAWSFENLAAYEKKRYQEVTKESTERIELLKTMMADGKSTDEEIVKAYEKKGGSRAFKHKALFVGSAKDIIDFEMGRMAKNQQDARSSHLKTLEISVSEDVKKAREKAREKASKEKGKTYSEEELKAIGEEAGLKEFFRQYAKNLDTISALKYGSIDSLLRYEQERLEHYAKKNEDYAHYNRAKSGKAFPDKPAQEIGDYQDKIDKELYRTATIQDLIEFEKSRNRGELGELLETYMAKEGSQKTAKDEQEAKAVLKGIFTKEKGVKINHRHAALTTFSDRLKKRESDENLKYMTIELLIEYAQKRKSKAKSEKDLKMISEELHFLNRAKIIVETSDPEKVLEEEQSQIRQYFNRYGETARQYQKDLSAGREINLKLMQAVFEEDKTNERMKMLTELASGDESLTDYEIVQKYLEMKDADKDKLSEFLKKRMQKDSRVHTAEEVTRYHASKLADDQGKNIKKHFIRYTKLQQMADGGASYSRLIEEYKKMEGSEGYADRIKEDIAKGILYGKDMNQGMTIEDVLKFEQDRILEAGAANQSLIDFIDQNEKTMSYSDLLSEYEKRSKEGSLNAVQKLIDERVTSLASDYERSKKDAVLTPQNLLDFEILDRERIGSSHSARLKELFGVDQLPDDLNELVVPTDEEQKEARRQKYLEEAKRFKRQQDIKLAEEEALADLTSDDDKMLQEMIRYEEDRKKYYENEFSELLHIHQDIMDREKTLEDEIRISYSVVMNINEIKEHPTEVFTKIQDFREGVELNKKRAEEEQKMKEEQEKLIMEAKKQKEEAEKKLLTEEEKEKEGKGAGEA